MKNKFISIKFSDMNKRENKYKFDVSQPTKPEVDEEMDGAWSYYVRTGDFSLVNNLREQRALSNYYMNRWD